MLDLMRCRIINSKEIPVLAGQVISDEGQGLVRDMSAGYEQAKLPVTNTQGSFLGFSYGFTMTPSTMSMVETVVVPTSSPYTCQLSKTTPITGQIFAIGSVTGALTLHSSADQSGRYTCSSTGLLTFHSAQAGETVTVTYRYYPTTQELFSTYKLNVYTQTPADVLNSVGVILSGEVYTSMFDASVNWATAGDTLYLITGGLVTTSAGSTNTSFSAKVINIPSTSIPFLGIRF